MSVAMSSLSIFRNRPLDGFREDEARCSNPFVETLSLDQHKCCKDMVSIRCEVVDYGKNCPLRAKHQLAHLVEIDIMNVVFRRGTQLLLGQPESCAILVARRPLYPRRANAEDFCLAWLFRRWPLDPNFAACDELGELDRAAGRRGAFGPGLAVQRSSQRVDWIHLVQRLRCLDPCIAAGVRCAVAGRRLRG